MLLTQEYWIIWYSVPRPVNESIIKWVIWWFTHSFLYGFGNLPLFLTTFLERNNALLKWHDSLWWCDMNMFSFIWPSSHMLHAYCKFFLFGGLYTGIAAIGKKFGLYAFCNETLLNCISAHQYGIMYCSLTDMNILEVHCDVTECSPSVVVHMDSPSIMVGEIKMYMKLCESIQQCSCHRRCKQMRQLQILFKTLVMFVMWNVTPWALRVHKNLIKFAFSNVIRNPIIPSI